MYYSLKKAFPEIVRRVPIPILQRKFRKYGLFAGRNSIDTLEKVNKILDEKKSRSNKKNRKALKRIVKWYFEDYLLHGEKSVYLFKLENKKEAKNIYELAKKFELDEHDFTNKYPFSLSESKLKKFSDQIVLVKVDEDSDQINITFCTSRYYINKVDIPKSYLKNKVLDRFDKTEEIIAVNYEYRQFFDSIIIHKNGLVEMRIDNPRMVDSKQIPVQERYHAFDQVLKAFESKISGLLDKTWILPEPLNLFPLIDKIYLKEGEGALRLLAFTTNNGGVKTITADGKNRKDCCRKDTYHKAGSKKINHDLNPYRLIIAWNKANSRPELFLLGTHRHLEIANKPLNEAIITRAEGKKDYDEVLSKLLSYL